jgi:hypothetical protein
MKKLFLAAALASVTGCASLADSVTNGAVNAAGGVADHAVTNAGDRATDSAIDHAANAGNHSGSNATAAAERNVTRMDPDDVLVLDGSSYTVGKVLGSPAADGTCSVLLIADGRKLSTKDVVRVRAASKTELKLGADVYYCADNDVRRGRWEKGSVTDTSKLSDDKIDVGSSRGLDVGGQVAVQR